VSGVVRIKDPGCKDTRDFQRWQNLLSKGTLVTISGSTVEPREVDIFTGQTVFFIVTGGRASRSPTGACVGSIAAVARVSRNAGEANHILCVIGANLEG
jgi:hypothetical protein